MGPEPPGREAELRREERWGAVVLLAGLADDDVELHRQAANAVAVEWTDQEAARLLLDAAILAEIGPQRSTPVFEGRLADGAATAGNDPRTCSERPLA